MQEQELEPCRAVARAVVARAFVGVVCKPVGKRAQEADELSTDVGSASDCADRLKELEVLHDVKIIPEVETTNLGDHIVPHLRALSQAEFDEDASTTSKKKKQRLALMTGVTAEGQEVLLGFMQYRPRQDMQMLGITKVAVEECWRGRGFGKKLVQWAIKEARKSKLSAVGLSALPSAIKFYQKLGFKRHDDARLKLTDNAVSGQVSQVYMELSCGRRRRK